MSNLIGLGDRIRILRKEKRLTQKQLAKMLGVQNSIISFYEVGDRMPSPEILVKLAAVLHVSTDYLMGVERGESVDISGLTDNDKYLVRALVDSLREKNQKHLQ